jgi:arylsulfatase A-like enzyme
MRKWTRREVLGTMASAAVSVGVVSRSAAEKTNQRVRSGNAKPNVIIIIVDDQAYGDLSCTGNTALATPNIDRLAEGGTRFSNHYGCPLCSPARASLLTGRYNYRSGVVDTSTGLAMMRPDEVNLAEVLANNGYRTFISSKWHLGDNYPLRPMDRGFHESLIAKDAIVAGIANPPNNSLFSPILYHNERPQRTEGYITDIAFNAALEFIEANRDQPYFVYLPTNVVHNPLEVAPHYSEPFKAKGFDDYTATLYGEMVNLDENVGRLHAKLAQLGDADNTIIFYTVDNGPIGPRGVAIVPNGAHRYNLGLRGGKGTIWEGGIKLPLFVTWPSRLSAGKKCEQIVSHIDVFPTVLDMCGLASTRHLPIDGRSLLPLAEGRTSDWPDRTLFFQQSRPDRANRRYWDEPRLFVNCAARGQKYKAVMTSEEPGQTYFQAVDLKSTRLYDIENDPGETTDISQSHPDIVQRLRDEYETWFLDVSRGISPAVRNVVGSPHQNPVVLTSQDMRGVRSALAPHELEIAKRQAQSAKPLGFGYWAIEVLREARYRIRMQFEPVTVAGDKCLWAFPFKTGEAFLRVGIIEKSQWVQEGTTSVTFDVILEPGRHFLSASVTGQREVPIEVSPFFVVIECLDIGTKVDTPREG